MQRYLGGFAGGGIVESITAIAREHFPGLSVTSSYRDSNDLHGAGKAVDLSNQYEGGPSTPLMQEAARFFYENYGPNLAELIHWRSTAGRTSTRGSRSTSVRQPTRITSTTCTSRRTSLSALRMAKAAVCSRGHGERSSGACVRLSRDCSML
ncbi:hypothetical protein GS436_12180 [Rhodococcus hoagii]|nr:hypothetical protein [Prescottella equi]